MKIGESPRLSTVARTRNARSSAATERVGTSGPATGIGDLPPIGDTITVMDIPEPELTPKVRAALMTLMSEVEQLRRDLSRTRERLADLERLADQDSLTPIANRRAFVRELSKVMSFTERYGGGASLIFFDVNELKTLNDTYGHAAGDEALLTIARRLLEHVRETDMIGRLGGDEFGVILAQADKGTAWEKAESLAAAIQADPFEWDGNQLSLSVAFGVHTFQPGDDASKALAEADRAMYEKKQKMKNGGG